MKDGRRVAPSPSLDDIRRHAKREFERLPEDLRRLTPGADYPIEVADDLVKLAADVDRRMAPVSKSGG
jgi:nicotinate phosphoribosyltransferase